MPVGDEVVLEVLVLDAQIEATHTDHGSTSEGIILMQDRRSDPEFAALLVGSYRRLVGRPLVETTRGDTPSADWLYGEAPFCLLAHDTSEDPRFIYANAAAQRCFGYAWSELMGLPSRLSAEAPEQTERQRTLETVTRYGFVENYRGIRVAKSGRRFFIEKATVWTLFDDDNTLHGQAAIFNPPSDEPAGGETRRLRTTA